MREYRNLPYGCTLGLTYTGLHDSAIAIVGPEGEILFACALERLTRQKHDGRWPTQLLQDLPWDRIDQIGIPTLSLPDAQQLGREFAIDGWPHPIAGGIAAVAPFSAEWAAQIAALPKPIRWFDHHHCHAASAWFLSGFRDGLVLTCDGGAHQSPWFATAWRGKGLQLQLRGGMHSGRFHSPATIYMLVTALLGLRPNRHEGKVTGLAARGTAPPERIARLQELVGPMVGQLSRFLRWIVYPDQRLAAHLAVNEHLRREWRRELREFSDQDLAACVQALAEDSALAMVRVAREVAGRELENICLAGGFFANVRVNQKVFAAGFQRGFVAPPMTDDGNAIGAALLAHLAAHPGRRSHEAATTMYLGPGIDMEAATRAMAEHGIRCTRPTDLPATLAEHLAAGQTLAVARGRMEFGPRALGHRSVLCGARNHAVNDWLNRKFQRTEYMPFAPITLADEAATDYPAIGGNEQAFRFMTVTTNCAASMQTAVPAVVHIDGTARPQLISSADEPFVAALLREYRQRTGIGTLLNTSFNMHEEPIACSAEDALASFASAQLDHLNLEDCVVSRAGNEAALDALLAARAKREGKGEPVEVLALSQWLTDAIEDGRREFAAHRDDVTRLRAAAGGLQQEMDRKSAEMGKLELVAQNFHQETSRLVLDLANRSANAQGLLQRVTELTQQNERLATELNYVKASLTLQAVKAFDDLRRGDVRTFATKVRGFVANRGGGLARRLLGRPQPPTSAQFSQPSDQKSDLLARARHYPDDAADLIRAPGRQPLGPTSPSVGLRALRAKVAAQLPAEPPRISALVPCFNYGALVHETVDSLLAQTYPSLEILVMDDGSTDQVTIDTLTALRSDRVTVIRQANQGLATARNNAAKHATGSFLLFLDNDDLLDPDAIALLFLELQKRPEVAFVYPDQRYFGDQSRVCELQDFNAFDLLWFNHCTVTALIRREAFESVRGYMHGVHGWEDWCHWLDLTAAGRLGGRLPLPLFGYRRHGRTMGHVADKMGALLRNKLIETHQSLYEVRRIAELKQRWRPLLTVVVLDGAAADLPNTLAELRRQSLQDFEVVVAGPDPDRQGSAATAGAARPTFVDEPTSCPANAAVRAAKGDLLFFATGDLQLSPTALEQLAWAAVAAPASGFVQAPVTASGAPTAATPHSRATAPTAEPRLVLVRRSAFVAAEGLRDDLQPAAQWPDLLHRLETNGNRGSVVSEPLARAVVRPPALHDATAPAQRPTQRPPDLDPVLDPVLDEFQVRYRRALMGKVPFEPYGRANIPNPFDERHWSDPRTHILYLIPFLGTGGAERVDLDILEGLDRTRYRVTLVVELGGDCSWRDRFEACVDEIFVLPRFVPEPSRLTFLEYLLMSRNVDLVFNRNTAVGYQAIGKWRQSFPTVRFADLLHSHFAGQDWVQAAAPHHQDLDRRFVVTRELLDYNVTTYALPASTFRVVHCGVDTAHWSRAEVATDTLRRELGIGSDAPIIGFVGRLAEEKDPVTWVRAAGKILEQVPNAQFVMIGHGPLEEAVKQATAAAGLRSRLHMLGRREDVRDLMGCFDVLLLTSRVEGLPIVILEGMSLGILAVAPDVGGIRECVRDGMGVLVPHNSPPEAYATAVVAVLRDERRAERSARAIELIQREFTLTRMQHQYAAEFQEMVAGVDRNQRLRTYCIRLMERPLL